MCAVENCINRTYFFTAVRGPQGDILAPGEGGGKVRGEICRELFGKLCGLRLPALRAGADQGTPQSHGGQYEEEDTACQHRSGMEGPCHGS